MRKEKVYSVEFMTYTNCMRDTVSDGNKNIGETECLDLGKENFLIRESELDFYKNFGNGFRKLTFVGYIRISE